MASGKGGVGGWFREHRDTLVVGLIATAVGGIIAGVTVAYLTGTDPPSTTSTTQSEVSSGSSTSTGRLSSTTTEPVPRTPGPTPTTEPTTCTHLAGSDASWQPLLSACGPISKDNNGDPTFARQPVDLPGLDQTDGVYWQAG